MTDLLTALNDQVSNSVFIYTKSGGTFNGTLDSVSSSLTSLNSGAKIIDSTQIEAFAV